MRECESCAEYSHFNLPCTCMKNWNVYLWSIGKETFIHTTYLLPKGFAFLSGCATAIDRNKLLLIGGHYVKKFDCGRDEYEMITKHALNNQVVEFNVSKRKWTVLQNIPLSNVRL